ncbi:type II toxin-antitoxin system RelE/ParE family toxin [Brevundimonas sp. NPDC046655]|uniref:type II toxin-antitoxin system RelE/ParE family toxin n=1 Tax=unclassified Brevundimonas TaxID=2622653 RepID=UPI00384B991E
MARGDATAVGVALVRLVWTRLASIDRKDIREYISADSPTAALASDELISEKAARLADDSGLGRTGRIPGTRELAAHRNYVPAYDMAADQIRILRVLHAARQWPAPQGFGGRAPDGLKERLSP